MSSSFESSVSSFSPPSFQDFLGELDFFGDHLVDPLFHRALADELVDEHVFLLADAKGPVGGLVFDGGVPPAVEMHDVRSRRQIEARAAGFERQDKKRRPLFGLKRLHQFPAFFHRRAAVEDQPRPFEHLARKTESGSVISRNWVKTSIFSWREETSSPISARRANFPLSFAAYVPIAQELAGMVANLLEPHQIREHQAPAFDACFLLERFFQLGDEFCIEGRLRFGQAAVGFDFGLLRQVGDDVLVGFQPPQDVRLH